MPVGDFFIICLYARSERLELEDAGNYYIDQPEDNDALNAKEVTLQIQYKLLNYKANNLVGSTFKEETDVYDDIVGNLYNIYIYTHEDLWNSSIEFVAKKEDNYHVIVRAESDILGSNFQNGEDTKIEIDCWVALSPEKAAYW